MNVRFSYDQRFEQLMTKIREKYGEDILAFSGVHPQQLDVADFTREFLFNGEHKAVADISVDANANVDDKSVVSFDHEVAKALNKLNALNMIWSYIIKVYGADGPYNAVKYGRRQGPVSATEDANRAIEDIVTCGLYLNDAHFVHKAYCYSFDLDPLVREGMPFVKKINIGPPQHFTSMINLTVQATAFISNQIAGAASFPNLFVYLDYFARKDFGKRYWENKETLDQVEQGLQNLVYSLNFSFRGSQSAFSNLSIYDRGFMETLFGNTIYPDGTKVDFESVDALQKVFINWFNKELTKQTFTFPVLTANLVTEDNEIQDKEFLQYVSEANLPYGIINFYTGPATCLSSCCRLRSELIHEHTNSLGTGSVSIGSHRVCTINLPRVAIESGGSRDQFFDILKKRIKTSHIVLNAHRQIMMSLIQKGRVPLYTYGWMDLKKQYSTVGLLGPYEACKFMGMDITSENGSDFVVEVMDLINEMNKAEEQLWNDGRRFNLELIPGEQAAIKLCEADKMLYPDFDNQYVLYSNQFIPLIDKSDIYTRMVLQGKFDSRAQGGCIMHINMDHQLRNAEQMEQLITSASHMGSLYFAVNLNIAWCENNHSNIGKGLTVCNTCGGKIVKNITRVVGFLTDVSDWNEVRRWEHGERYFYKPEEFDTDEEEFHQTV